MIETGALLHDIGKLLVDGAILNKETTLTSLEFAEIKKHPQYGKEILSRYGFEQEIMDMVLSHHERWNGEGYPNQLKATNIPFFARILGLIDSIEAMTGIRPYRTSLSWEEAIEEVKRGKGTLYDPTLTDQCIIWMEQNSHLKIEVESPLLASIKVM